MKREQIRQGDVLLEAIEPDEIPANATPVAPENGRYILAHGEVTGHAHAVVADERVTMLERDGVLYLRVTAQTELTHDEHTAHSLTAPAYRKVQQREYHPEAIRNVID